MLNSLRMFESSAVAQQRLKIIELDERYGEKATKEAFGADRKLIWRWRHSYFHQPQGRVYHDPESKWAAKRNAGGGRRNIEKNLMSQISLT